MLQQSATQQTTIEQHEQSSLLNTIIIVMNKQTETINKQNEMLSKMLCMFGKQSKTFDKILVSITY